MAVTDEPFSISLKEAAALIGTSERNLCAKANAGDLPGAYRFGRRWFVVRHRLIEWIEGAAQDP